MEDVNYHIEMQVVTPLSVGAGNEYEWMRGVDYVQTDNKVYVLDMSKAVASGVDINRLSELFLKSDEVGICRLLGDNLAYVSSRIFPSPAKTTNNIKAFLRTQLYDKPLVAGSSVKGAIRSVLFKALRSHENDNKAVFGNMNDGTDFMRFFHIGDIEMPSSILVNTKLFNLRKDGTSWSGGWKQGLNETTASFQATGFNTLYECVQPGQCGYGTISMTAHVFEMMMRRRPTSISHAQEKKEIMQSGLQGLFHLINQSSRAYLEKEKAFFEKYPAERSDEVIDSIDRLLSMIPTNDSCCLMKMSAGVGFHAITGDWQFEDYDQTGIWYTGRHAGKKKYKSRKIAEYDGRLQLMGFVKMRTLNEQEILRIEAQQTDEHQAKLDSILHPIIKKEEAQRVAAEQAREKAQKEEEARQRNAEFELLIDEATTLYLNDQWDEAIAKAKEASAILPERSEPSELITKCETQKEIFGQPKQPTPPSSENNAPLSVVLKGVSSAGNMIGRTTKWIKSGNSFGESEYSVLLNAIMTLSSGERKNMAVKKRKELVKAIGEELANRLINEVGT